MRVVDLTAGLDLNQIDALLAVDDTEQSVETAVAEVLKDVRQRGDIAVCEYSKRFDGFELTPDSMRVPAETIAKYAADADDELVEILRRAAANVREFHEQQAEDSWEFYAGDGIRLGLRLTSIASTGIYIP